MSKRPDRLTPDQRARLNHLKLIWSQTFYPNTPDAQDVYREMQALIGMALGCEPHLDPELRRLDRIR